MAGLASIFDIKCHLCGKINKIKTSSEHRSGKRGRLTYDINTRAVLGSLHAGIGNTHLNNLFSTMNIPTMNNRTFKSREREVGCAVEVLAQASCKKNMEVEKKLAEINGEVADENGLVGIPVSYDMGWQKRGKGHNSLTGQGVAMGIQTGNVLAYATKCKSCRVCEFARKKGKQPRVHDCRKNHAGSSKAMEPAVACELWNSAPTENVKFSTYVGDDDTTTLCHLSQNVPYGVEKWSDIVHAKRSLTTRLYNIATRCKFENSSTLSQKVINYLGKCFTYSVAQNRDKASLKSAIKNIVPHAFGDHHGCCSSWCGYKKDPLTYKHRDLPYNKDLMGNELKKALTSLFEEYATDTVAEKLLPFANSQRNESLNSTIGSKNPKIRFYGGSESNDFRVACAVAQKNIGFSYISNTLESLGIDPGATCVFHSSLMDKKQQNDKKRKSLKEYKIRRHQLQSERISKNAQKEAREGKTYQTGIGLNLEKESSFTGDTTNIDIDGIIRNITTDHYQEYRKSVPPFIERPKKKYLTYDREKRYLFVLFDTETTCTGKQAEICQLSAITQNGEIFSSYIMPKGSVGYYASKVNNLTVEIINGERTLCKSFDPVNSVSLETALQSFTKFLEKNLHTYVGNQDNLVTVIVGHNAATFDVPTLLRNSGNSFEDQLYNMNICFGDSLPLIRTLLSRQHSPLKQSNGEFCQANLGSVYKCLFNEDFNAHDALEDAIALRKILFSSEMAIEVNTIVDCCQISSVIDVKADLKFIDNRHDRYQTFVGNLYSPNEDHGSITHGMALKIAESGLSYNDLLALWEKFGEPGVVGILSMPPYELHDRSQRRTSDKSRPRVTKNKRILSNIVKYFKSNNISNTSNSS